MVEQGAEVVRLQPTHIRVSSLPRRRSYIPDGDIYEELVLVAIFIVGIVEVFVLYQRWCLLSPLAGEIMSQ